jgi:hypothetical protein
VVKYHRALYRKQCARCKGRLTRLARVPHARPPAPIGSETNALWVAQELTQRCSARRVEYPVVQAGAPKAWAWEVKDLALPRQQAMSDGMRGPWPPRLQIAGAPRNARVAPAQCLPGAEQAAQHEAPLAPCERQIVGATTIETRSAPTSAGDRILHRRIALDTFQTYGDAPA